MSSRFYNDFTELYMILSNDRDFKKELFNIGALSLKRNSVFVELFAGPAYHSICLEKYDFEGKIYAIDSSSAMMKVARNMGFSGEYLCKDVNEALSEIEFADLFFVPRYSIVLIDNISLKLMLERISVRMNKSSNFVLEVSSCACTDGSKYIAGDLDEEGLYKREIFSKKATVRNSWPHDIKYLKDNSAEITAIIEVENGILKRKHEFVTREYLYTKNFVKELAKEYGLKEKDCIENGESAFIVFERDS